MPRANIRNIHIYKILYKSIIYALICIYMLRIPAKSFGFLWARMVISSGSLRDYSPAARRSKRGCCCKWDLLRSGCVDLSFIWHFKIMKDVATYKHGHSKPKSQPWLQLQGAPFCATCSHSTASPKGWRCCICPNFPSFPNSAYSAHCHLGAEPPRGESKHNKTLKCLHSFPWLSAYTHEFSNVFYVLLLWTCAKHVGCWLIWNKRPNRQAAGGTCGAASTAPLSLGKPWDMDSSWSVNTIW